MVDPKVNGGIHGCLTYNAEIIKEIKGRVEKLKQDFPISDVQVYLASTRDERWNGKETQKCKDCDISQAGYRSKDVCQGCSDQPAH